MLRQKKIMPVVRELIESARGFERCSAMHVRELGLTPPQFDIIATLGNTPGMTCKELGQKTLITKGTLTGVLDRLAGKGLLERTPSPDDGRSWITRLTPQGQALFEEIFPLHIAHLNPLFDSFSDDELATMRQQLRRLREAFEAHNAHLEESAA
ncbi:MAG: MarR family transcriptional regulator [Betaproteobacteria bacterium]|nr:MarR family transcriptional regulator [Betaproteobacteria bacterium]